MLCFCAAVSVLYGGLFVWEGLRMLVVLRRACFECMQYSSCVLLCICYVGCVINDDDDVNGLKVSPSLFSTPSH